MQQMFDHKIIFWDIIHSICTPGSPMIITVVAQLVHLGVKCGVKVTYDNLVILIALELRPT